MVAGHAISRPRIQLTRMDEAAMAAARERQAEDLGLAPPQAEQQVMASCLYWSVGSQLSQPENDYLLIDRLILLLKMIMTTWEPLQNTQAGLGST